MCYLYLKLRVFLKRKIQPKNTLKGIISFLYNIDRWDQLWLLAITSLFCKEWPRHQKSESCLFPIFILFFPCRNLFQKNLACTTTIIPLPYKWLKILILTLVKITLIHLIKCIRNWTYVRCFPESILISEILEKVFRA